MAETARADADGGWKDIIEQFTEEFFEFYFPEVHAAIDFVAPLKFLDNELREITADSEAPGREVDKLIEVQLRSGEIEWLLVHIEVQGYPDDSFPERVFISNYRIFDKYHRDVISLAVFTDGDPDFRPREYRRDMLGFEVVCRFPTVKLIEYDAKVLDASDNPFALVTQIQLEYLAVGSDPQQRLRARVALTRRLFRRGYTREQVIGLLKFLGFVLRLPPDLAIQYREELRSTQGDSTMAYRIDIEELALKEGREEGLLIRGREDVIDALEARFGDVPYLVREAINHVDSGAELKELHRRAILVKTLDEFSV